MNSHICTNQRLRSYGHEVSRPPKGLRDAQKLLGPNRENAIVLKTSIYMRASRLP